MLNVPAEPLAAHFPVLLVGACASLRSIIRNMQCEVQQATTCKQAIGAMLIGDIPVVLTDARLSDGDWRTIVHEAQRLRVPPSIIVVSDSTDSRLWADVLAAGGYDSLRAPWTEASVSAKVQGAFCRWQRANEIEAARQQNALALRPMHASAS
jgi:DNA-binding NtrC family response regulator